MTLRIDTKLAAALTALAYAEGVPREEIVRLAVLDRYERAGHAPRVQDSTGRMRERWAAVLKRLGGA
ncbi:MAG: ribbon-helix-helix protein, CopG family [Actinomycetota bacterium]|nr:ribbon-helix-helix protein, CopG family [Actinomycetota bacterium]